MRKFKKAKQVYKTHGLKGVIYYFFSGVFFKIEKKFGVDLSVIDKKVEPESLFTSQVPPEPIVESVVTKREKVIRPYRYDFINLHLERNGIDLSKKSSQVQASLVTVNWYIPNVGVTSGGHLNIFRMIRQFEKSGYENRLYIVGDTNFTSEEEVHNFLETYFLPIKPKVFFNPENSIYADISIATSWMTAYFVANNNSMLKFYFVQDYEPFFYPISSESVFAENTYKLGLNIITGGKWLKKLLKESFNVNADYIDFAYDKDIYKPDKNVKRAKNRICFYARYITPRRAVELGVLSLKLVLEKRKDIIIDCFGWDVGSSDLPFEFVNHGVLKDKELAKLYCGSTIGLVFSLTNHTLITPEMMACGLPVIDLDGDNNRTIYSNNEVFLVEKTPKAIADGILELLDNKDKYNGFVERGFEFVEKLSWKKSTKDFEDIVMGKLRKIK